MDTARLSIWNRSGNAKSPSVVAQILWEDALEFGNWTDWIMRAKFSQTGTDGFVQISRNGVKIAERMNTILWQFTAWRLWRSRGIILRSDQAFREAGAHHS